MTLKVGDIVVLKTGSAPQIVLDVKNVFHVKHIYCKYLDYDRVIEQRLLYDNGSDFKLEGYLQSYKSNYHYRSEKDFNYYNGDGNNISNHVHPNRKITYRSKTMIRLTARCSFCGEYAEHTKCSCYPEKQTKEKGKPKMSKLYQVKTAKGLSEEYGVYLATNGDGKYVLEMKNGKNNFQAYAPSELEEVVPWTFCVHWSNGQNAHYVGDKDIVKAGDIFFNKKTMVFGKVDRVNTKNGTSTPLNAMKLDGLTEFNSTSEPTKSDKADEEQA